MTFRKYTLESPNTPQRMMTREIKTYPYHGNMVQPPHPSAPVRVFAHDVCSSLLLLRRLREATAPYEAPVNDFGIADVHSFECTGLTELRKRPCVSNQRSLRQPGGTKSHLPRRLIAIETPTDRGSYGTTMKKCLARQAANTFPSMEQAAL